MEVQMTKVMIINGSPRKNFNTAKLLKKQRKEPKKTERKLKL